MNRVEAADTVRLGSQSKGKLLELSAEDSFPVPAWFHQQQSWVRQPSESDSAAYNHPLSLRIQGPLNQKALEASFQEIVRRHEVLRSVFRNVDGKLVQIVVPAPPIEIPVIDLSPVPEAQREARACRLVVEEANRPFDLRRGPLLRVGLLQLGVEDHILQLTTHDIVYDDWSTGILIRELSTLYPVFAAGSRSPLSELTFQYGDFVRWQQERLQGRELDSRLGFWKQQLNDKNEFHHLAIDQARPVRPTYRGAREVMTFSDDKTNFLKVASQREQVSPFMMLLAAFQCLLHRYSGHKIIGVASCAANRSLVEVEGLIGRFGNVFILCTDLSGNPMFRELLGRIRETALTAYSYQDLPFGELVEKLAPLSDPSRNPLFQAMFFLLNAPRVECQIPGLKLGWLPVENGTAKYDLTVWLKMEPKLEVTAEYSTDLFKAATIRRLLEHYQTILEAMVNNPTQRISDIRIELKQPPIEMQRATPEEISAPREEMESKLVEIWEAVLRIRPIGINQNFFELGGDSLLAAQLFARVEAAFRVKLPVVTLFKAATVEELAKVLREHRSEDSQSCLVVVKEGSQPFPIFCVHDHTGEILFCRGLARHLDSERPLYGLQAKALTGNPPHRTIEEMAADYIREIRLVQEHGPYFLFGYCFGGMVAFEMARLLQSQGEEVALLAMFDTPTPGSLKGWPFAHISYRRIQFELMKIRTLPVKEKIVRLSTKTRNFAQHAFGILRTSTGNMFRHASFSKARGWSERIMSVADLNIQAAKAYHPQAYLGRITLLLTKEVPFLYAVDPKLGWNALATGGVEVQEVPGDNQTLFIEGVAQQLRLCLDRIEAEEAND